ncbi:arginine--tRNA ligase [Ureaplasma miroungigenitalium]|uniref:arginine--tRNA ligase n=1 Tax=Ureaplasma miroungigenitalium TaxID=1042321 RepID=UPI0021E92E49|nr:arginine--tRNA ligase [Ureaplasma miroungigenitalium]MCV3734411.1 arginine--tRNA ligase [Ureaplasma miroungigenitalium]
MIIGKIKKIIDFALSKLGVHDHTYIIDKTSKINHGDFYTNVALTLSKQLKRKPMDIATEIVDLLNAEDNMLKTNFLDVQISVPGFINFFIKSDDHDDLLNLINKQKNEFPIFAKENKKYLVEYVSANPTGLLHIGHAANAVYGDLICALLKKCGYDVVSEYYVNDAGNQIDKLASSVLVRYLQSYDQTIELIDDAYHGQEIFSAAQALREQFADKFTNLTLDDTFTIVDHNQAEIIKQFCVDYFLSEIKKDLLSMHTEIQHYTSEKAIRQTNLITETLGKLKNHTYEQDQALWLRTTDFGDDKDRVLIKSNGAMTYFLPDIAYHYYKLQTHKPDVMINLFGTDHLGYITRLKAGVSCFGFDPDNLIILTSQIMKLTKNNEEFKLSKRSGQSLTIRDLIEVIGANALRWFLGSSSINTHVVIDVDVALAKDNNNPLFYVQYAHARCFSLLNKNRDIPCVIQTDLLSNEKERALLDQLHYFKKTISVATQTFSMHKIANYLYELANLLHNYYANIKIIDHDNLTLTGARLGLIHAVKQVLKNGLALLKIPADNEMY